MKKRKAVSPAVTTMLLMAVAVAGSVAVWQAMNTQAQTISQSSKLDLVDASLVRLQAGGKAFFSVTLKNSGSTKFETVEAGFWDDGNQYHSIKSSTPLLPGQQWSGEVVFDADITNNQKYAVRISGVASDGSRFSMARTVFAV